MRRSDGRCEGLGGRGDKERSAGSKGSDDAHEKGEGAHEERSAGSDRRGAKPCTARERKELNVRKG